MSEFPIWASQYPSIVPLVYTYGYTVIYGKNAATAVRTLLTRSDGIGPGNFLEPGLTYRLCDGYDDHAAIAWAEDTSEEQSRLLIWGTRGKPGLAEFNRLVPLRSKYSTGHIVLLPGPPDDGVSWVECADAVFSAQYRKGCSVLFTAKKHRHAQLCNVNVPLSPDGAVMGYDIHPVGQG